MNPKVYDSPRREKRDSGRAEVPDLDSRYGRIGIPAVAAAIRYRGDARNPTHQPAPTTAREKSEKREKEDAAA
ncbi:MAG: hypothetical protein IRZ09_09640 [Variibacter sp.]|nr:hypothetical protein [Variibacter sp.]